MFLDVYTELCCIFMSIISYFYKYNGELYLE